MKFTSQMICCVALVLVMVATAFAQTPTSGAMLSIDSDMSSAVTVHAKIYDSQIHTGNVRQVALGSGCTSGDQMFPTDAYVLQGGSWTGCDPGDTFETSQGTGQATLAGFGIQTTYTFGGTNSNGTITAGPDTGFLTVTNNTGSPFTGTISLTGTSTTLGGFCPLTGVALDSKTFTTDSPLNNGGTWTFALSTDSSNCGGFNAPQTRTIMFDGTPLTFPIGGDAVKITPENATIGDKITITPVPYPAGPLGLNSWGAGKFGQATPTGTSPFTATNFPTLACIPYADFSATNNPVCMEYTLSCTPFNPDESDCLAFLQNSEADFSVDGRSLPNGIGGPHYLVKHSSSDVTVNCPSSAFDQDIWSSYTATSVSDPIRGGSTSPSCYTVAFDPTAAPVPAGTTVFSPFFGGFESPVSNTDVNLVKKTQNVPLKWNTVTPDGNPLTLCTMFGGSGCSGDWVFIGTVDVPCNGNVAMDTITATTSTSGNGLMMTGTNAYQFNLAVGQVTTATGCFNVVMEFPNGLISSTTQFKLH